MADLNVYFVSNDKFDFTMWIDKALTWGALGTRGAREMVQSLIGLCSRGDKIAKLTIVGHGNEYGQYVGQDWLCKEAIPAWREELVKMTGLFAMHGEVVMGGCRQGRNAGLLLALSDIWNVPVSGFTALQRPVLPGDEGGRTTCFLTCTRSGYTAADHFDAVQLRVMQTIREAARYVTRT
jgi:hypothetical protein